ncbi:MAG: dual specificity protein phosphatase family protein [Moraxellaceae bacterium]|nr:dual specificity protein phosphatase family protein [Moraxellaceae bacterium]
MHNKPFEQSFWVKEDMLCVGHYPCDRDKTATLATLNGLLDCGIRRVINLMEADETNYNGEPFVDYSQKLAQLAHQRNVDPPECLRVALRDAQAPTIQQMKAVLKIIDDSIKHNIPTYMHCWGGHGRTGTVVCCYLISQGKTAKEAMAQLSVWRQGLPKRHFPLESNQQSFIEQWL